MTTIMTSAIQRKVGFQYAKYLDSEWLFTMCQSSNTLTFSNNCIAFPSAQGLKKRHRRERTSEGLTNEIQSVRDCRSK